MTPKKYQFFFKGKLNLIFKKKENDKYIKTS